MNEPTQRSTFEHVLPAIVLRPVRIDDVRAARERVETERLAHDHQVHVHRGELHGVRHQRRGIGREEHERKQTQHKELKSEPTARTVQNLGNANGLLENIDKKMKEERIYRDAGLTLEKAAELIGTNRTYLSASIKQQTGLSFSYYVNSYRIQEAIELLSGPENDIPLKAVLADVGFKSPTTFYKLFQATTGQTPQKWRENIRQECLERHSSD